MHSRIAEVIQLLEESRAILSAAVETVPVDDRGTRPGPDRWSTAEVLDHLGKVEGSIAGLFSTRIADARANGLAAETDTSSVVDATRIERLKDRNTTIEAAGNAQPSTDVDWQTAWTTLHGTRAKLVAALADGDGLAIGTLTLPHRIFGPMDFYQWVVFTAGHEQRHAAQIRSRR